MFTYTIVDLFLIVGLALACGAIIGAFTLWKLMSRNEWTVEDIDNLFYEQE